MSITISHRLCTLSFPDCHKWPKLFISCNMVILLVSQILLHSATKYYKRILLGFIFKFCNPDELQNPYCVNWDCHCFPSVHYQYLCVHGIDTLVKDNQVHLLQITPVIFFSFFIDHACFYQDQLICYVIPVTFIYYSF